MGVKGKLVSQISIKTEGDVFHLLKFPNLFPKVTPQLIQRVDLLEGHWGTPGSVICWYYAQERDGKELVSKEIIEAIDEKKKSITFKAIEGALLMDSFKAFKIIADLTTNGEDNLITWTMEYEKKNEGVAEPREIMDYFFHLTKQIECNYQLIPN